MNAREVVRVRFHTDGERFPLVMLVASAKDLHDALQCGTERAEKAWALLREGKAVRVQGCAVYGLSRRRLGWEREAWPLAPSEDGEALPASSLRLTVVS